MGRDEMENKTMGRRATIGKPRLTTSAEVRLAQRAGPRLDPDIEGIISKNLYSSTYRRETIRDVAVQYAICSRRYVCTWLDPCVCPPQMGLCSRGECGQQADRVEVVNLEILPPHNAHPSMFNVACPSKLNLVCAIFPTSESVVRTSYKHTSVSKYSAVPPRMDSVKTAGEESTPHCIIRSGLTGLPSSEGICIAEHAR